ncbi:hypothetical protein THTE_0244 [Thermogutta terrifontis]|uniref:Uncharacterized protein n=1 Tax=Thermogutta terrifontis TaxID=1331910 RepID=A0A286RA63_9BACT|nr:hypothetical protein THTE_0244 [Thermogutta terrifontis]
MEVFEFQIPLTNSLNDRNRTSFPKTWSARSPHKIYAKPDTIRTFHSADGDANVPTGLRGTGIQAAGTSLGAIHELPLQPIASPPSQRFLREWISVPIRCSALQSDL